MITIILLILTAIAVFYSTFYILDKLSDTFEWYALPTWILTGIIGGSILVFLIKKIVLLLIAK
jgi:hypothetical protein